MSQGEGEDKDFFSDKLDVENFSKELVQLVTKIEIDLYNEKVDIAEEFNANDSLYHTKEFSCVYNNQDAHNLSQENMTNMSKLRKNTMSGDPTPKNLSPSKNYHISNQDIDLNQTKKSDKQSSIEIMINETGSNKEPSLRHSKISQRTQNGFLNKTLLNSSKYRSAHKNIVTEGDYDDCHGRLNGQYHHMIHERNRVCEKCETTKKFLTRYTNVKPRNTDIESFLLDFFKFENKNNYFGKRWQDDSLKKVITGCEEEIDCLLEILALIAEFSQYAQRSLFTRKTGSKENLNSSINKESGNRMRNSQNSRTSNSMEKQDDLILPP